MIFLFSIMKELWYLAQENLVNIQGSYGILNQYLWLFLSIFNLFFIKSLTHLWFLIDLKQAKNGQNKPKKFQGPIFRDIDKCLKNRWISSMIWTNFLLMLYLGHSLKSTLEIIQWNLMKMIWGICLMKMESPLLQSVLIKMGQKCKYVMLFIVYFTLSFTSLNIHSFFPRILHT